MKALTLHQPWASLIALGVKTIETRSWTTKYRGPLAIHAGAAMPRYDRRYVKGFHCTRDAWGGWCLTGPGCGSPTDYTATALPLGAVVSTCTLVDVVPIIDSDDAAEAEWENLPYPRIESTCMAGDEFPDGWLDPYHPTLGDPIDLTGGRAIPDQAPYGDFSPGRFAWLLADIVPLDPPVPAKGRQGLWAWTP